MTASNWTEVPFLLPSVLLLGSLTSGDAPHAHSGAPGDCLSKNTQGISCLMLGLPDLAMLCCLLLVPDYSFTYLINSLIQNSNHGYYKSFSRLSKTTSYVPMATAAWAPWLQGQFSASRQPSEQFSSNYPVFFFNLCIPSNEHATQQREDMQKSTGDEERSRKGKTLGRRVLKGSLERSKKTLNSLL